MNVLLVSECDHRALTETRRILDQFAERRGERCWQTPITQAGLDALHALLRKSARKNTAVACHWLRAERPQLLWIVGDRRRFNTDGAVPVQRTRRNVRRSEDESPMKDATLLRCLVDLSALLHDLGKLQALFQSKLRGTDGHERNVLRHEWISLRLWQAFVGTDDDAAWLQRLAAMSAADDATWEQRLTRDGIDEGPDSPLKCLAHAPLAQAIGWLVLTHHRLPVAPGKGDLTAPLLGDGWVSKIDPEWNERNFRDGSRSRDAAEMQRHWQLAAAARPWQHPDWRKRAARSARTLLRLLERSAAEPLQPLTRGYLMHTARLCLMLADHRYSALPYNSCERFQLSGAEDKVWANTRLTAGKPGTKADSQPVCKQTLDEHLQAVARLGATLAHGLHQQLSSLPKLGPVPALNRRSGHEKYHWQDCAADCAAQHRAVAEARGAFIVNLASTGCGKTLANARLMQALAHPENGMRCAFALGLRTLTVQTGRALQERLHLKPQHLAVLVGGSAGRDLLDKAQAAAAQTGSESAEPLLDPTLDVASSDDWQRHPLLRAAVSDERQRQLLLAPVLVCTIDHLTPATESERGGHQILPMLRLMSSDLVLDEIDDFDCADLPAIGRLVHWAGLFGARVLVSSATLTPHLLQGLYDAYLRGRKQYEAQHPGLPKSSGASCFWVDEQDCTWVNDVALDSFSAHHLSFARQRAQHLAERALAQPLRCFRLLPLQALADSLPKQVTRTQIAAQLAPLLLAEVQQLHSLHHETDPVTHRRVSLGLIRIANINSLVPLALALHRQGAPAGLRLHLCAYHSRHPLGVRSGIEEVLDRVLQRTDPKALWRHPELRERLDAEPQHDHAFIVLGSPVTEVGRDHSYDWAVVEPSSMRSLIQLAGRVRRHQGLPASPEPNIVVLSRNLRSLNGQGLAYCKPGFEASEAECPDARLQHHDLADLLPPATSPAEQGVIDSRPRLLPAEPLQPRQKLADLEHQRMKVLFQRPSAGATKPSPSQAWAYPFAKAAAHLTALPQQRWPFRWGDPQIDLAVQPDGLEGVLVKRVDERNGALVPTDLSNEELLLYPLVFLPQDQGVRTWATPPIQQVAPGPTNKVMPQQIVSVPAHRDGASSAVSTLSLCRPGQRWRYHPLLGLWQGLREDPD